MRTDSMEGEFEKLPTIGERFQILGDALTIPGGIRLIDTSPVVEVTWVWKPKVLLFVTENSLYLLHSIKEVFDA